MKPFVSDGCSGGMSWAWRTFLGKPTPWEDLCVEHDRAYHAGGPTWKRAKADADLYDAVRQRGYPIWAWVIYVSIRLGGAWWVPAKRWRWGYGYRYPRYK